MGERRERERKETLQEKQSALRFLEAVSYVPHLLSLREFTEKLFLSIGA
jgi:hypothetical protein